MSITIEKTKSGKYRIRQQYNGKRYSATVSEKPTQKEAEKIMLGLRNEVPKNNKGKTFADSAQDYIAIKKNVFSARTIREYNFYATTRLPKWFLEMKTDDITTNDVQKCINELSATKSPKTVADLHGFIKPVLKQFRPDLILDTSLPKGEHTEPYIPDTEDVRVLLEYTKEHAPHFYAAIFLAGFSLRRSELIALSLDDIDEKGFLHVDKAKVQDIDGNWVIKITKTGKSSRVIPLPPDVLEIIKEQGCIYKCAPQSVSNYMKRTQKKLGLEEFSLHKMRHYCCSRLIEMGYSFKDAQAFGGWSSDDTPRRVYLHTLKVRDDEARKEISDKLAEGMSL